MISNYSTASGSTVSIPGAVTLSGNLSAARFLAGSDSLAAPGFSWQADPNTGLANGAADRIDLSTGGANNLNVGAAAMNANIATAFNAAAQFNVIVDYAAHLRMGSGTQILADAGTSNAPGYAFNGDSDNGLYRIAADVTGFGIAGSTPLYTGQTTVAFNVPYFSPETSEPSAGADTAWLFAVDNGSGKTQLKAKVGAAGTVVVLATEV